MRILIVHPSFHVYGGAEYVIVKLAEYLTKNNIDVDVLTTCMIPEVKDAMRVNNVFIEDSPDNMSDKLKSIYKEYDVINYHNHPSELMLNVKHPSVWYCNEPSEEVMNGATIKEEERKFVTEVISKFVVADEFNFKRFKSIYGVEPKIIPYGVDYDFWSKGVSDRWYWNLKDTDFVMLHSAWMHPRKNQLRSLECLNNLKDKIPNIKLVLCGQVTFPYAAEIVKYIQDNKLEEYIVIDAGFMSREKLRDLYASCDVLIHPIKTQGGWLTPFEAMAANPTIDIIVSKDAGCADMIKDNQLGVIANNNYEEIISSFYDSKYDVTYLDNRTKFVKESLSYDRYGKKMLKLFKEVCQ